MTRELTEISAILGQVERLAAQLRADPDRFIHRSAMELRATFDDRRAIEAAFTRVRISVRTLRQVSHATGGAQPATTLDFLDDVLEQELLPRLRRSGFDV